MNRKGANIPNSEVFQSIWKSASPSEVDLPDH